MVMKRRIVLLLALLLTTIGSPAYARKNKKEKQEAQQKKADIKAWRQQKNDMEPLQLKDLVEQLRDWIVFATQALMRFASLTAATAQGLTECPAAGTAAFLDSLAHACRKRLTLIHAISQA